MVKKCCINGCNISDDDLQYFRFPRSQVLKQQWLSVINIEKVTGNSLVCENHFTSNDYVLVKGKRRLKEMVVPTVFEYKLQKTDVPNGVAEERLTQDTAINSRLQSDSSDDDIPLRRSTRRKAKKHVKLRKKSLPKPAKPEIGSDDVDKTKEIRREQVNNTEISKANTELSPEKIKHKNTSNSPPKTQTPDLAKQDIEEILTNYQIRQPVRRLEVEERKEDKIETVDLEECPVEPELGKQSQPVFVEISADQEPNCRQDCLMLLESVQVELNPHALLATRETLSDSDEAEPISLLTSSDESDVILQEPHIDTVEVSDETDEDDVPLVKLTKSPKLEPQKILIADYHCIQCSYSSLDSTDYQKHMREHETAIQICEMCQYATASKAQFSRHKRKHKEERKYKCHLCDFRARHNMSLIYHLKSHDESNLSNAKKGFKCDKCGFKSNNKSEVLKHVRLCSRNVKMHCCPNCSYETQRKSDLKRHILRKHREYELDEEYLPSGWT